MLNIINDLQNANLNHKIPFHTQDGYYKKEKKRRKKTIVGALLVRMKNSIATVEDSLAGPQKLNLEL